MSKRTFCCGLLNKQLVIATNLKKFALPLPVCMIVAAGLLGGYAHASNPKSIKHLQDVVKGDEIYGQYLVLCSNGKEATVSSWDNNELWCLGDGLKETCFKRQLKIAKISCRGA